MAIQVAAITNVDELPQCGQHGCGIPARYKYLWTGNWYSGCEKHTRQAIEYGNSTGHSIRESVVRMVLPDEFDMKKSSNDYGD